MSRHLQRVRRWVRSVCALVVLAGGLTAGLPATAHAAQGHTIEYNDLRQTVEGFGAASNYFVRYMDALSAGEQNEIFDALFAADGAGMTIIRHEPWGGGCDGDEAERCPDDRIGTKPNPLSHSMAPGEFELDCPDTPDPSGRCRPGRLRDHYQVWFHREAAERQSQLLPWLNQHNPPEYMKTVPYDNSPLRQDQYQAYADYLSRSVRAYRDSLGIPVRALSVANEPPLSYADKLVWSYANLNRFTSEYLVPTLAADGVNVDLMAAEDVSWSDTRAELYDDPVTRGAIDIHAAHAYSGGLNGSWQRDPLSNCKTGPVPRAVQAGKRIWMSECTLGPSTMEQAVRNARRIHEFFTGAQGNAWVWWRYVTGSDSSTLPDGRAGLVQINDRTGAYDIKESVYTTAQFSRFVRPGWRRIDATVNPAPGVFVSAFRDPGSGQFAVIVVNENTADGTQLDLALDGVSTTQLSEYRTSSGERVANLGPVTVSGGVAAVSLPGQSVTTFMGSGGSGGPGEYIVDNASPLFSKAGSWTPSSAVPGFYGTGYWHDGTAGADTGKTATWNSPITATGTYDVYLRWTSAPDRPDAVPVEVNYDGGVATGITVNQRTGGGSWSRIGRWRFTGGSGDHVRISASDGGYTIADAVRFVRID